MMKRGESLSVLNIPIALGVDGISPFTYSNHSMWPVAAVNLHLPQHERFKLSRVWVVMVIPGPKVGGKVSLVM